MDYNKYGAAVTVNKGHGTDGNTWVGISPKTVSVPEAELSGGTGTKYISLSVNRVLGRKSWFCWNCLVPDQNQWNRFDTQNRNCFCDPHRTTEETQTQNERRTDESLWSSVVETRNSSVLVFHQRECSSPQQLLGASDLRHAIIQKRGRCRHDRVTLNSDTDRWKHLLYSNLAGYQMQMKGSFMNPMV